MIGYVHSIDTFGTLDGPGIRTVVFMQGCRLRCKYCHNPDTWRIEAPTAQQCTSDDLMKIIVRGVPYFQASGGGVTFSGGEPLLQHEFVQEVFNRCQQKGIHTAVDTSLYVPEDVLREAIPFINLVLADIKQFNPEKSVKLTGLSNEMNLTNLRLLDENKVSIWIRYVVVPGWTDDAEDIERMAEFIGELEQVKRVELIPYHSLGIHKWEMLGLDYELRDTLAPERELMDNLVTIVRQVSGKPACAYD